jgi:hypothetical protein
VNIDVHVYRMTWKVVNMLRGRFRKTAAKVCINGGLTVVALVVMSACASTSSPGTGTSSPTSGLPHLTVHRSGGIAGVSDTLTVEPSGAWSATDKAGHQRHGQLTAGQIGTLTPLTTDPRLAAEATRATGRSQCADAFNYTVAVANLQIAYTDCPADPDQPTATMALVHQLQQATA